MGFTMADYRLPEDVLAFLEAGPRTGAASSSPRAAGVVAPAAAQEVPSMARPVSPPPAHDGLEADKLGLLHEPLYVSAYRLRVGTKERVPLPDDGQRWTLAQVRVVEGLIEHLYGGGDYEVEVRDDKNAMYEWRFKSGMPVRPSPQEAPTMTSPQQPFNPLSMFGLSPQQPAAGAAQPGQPVQIPGTNMQVVNVPGMPPMIVQQQPGNGNTLREDFAGPSTPWRGAGGFGAPPWGSPWGSPWGGPPAWGSAPGSTPSKEQQQEVLNAKLAEERAKAEAERARLQAEHEKEMAAIRAEIAKIGAQSTGPSPELAEMRAHLAKQEAELKAAQERAALEQRMAEQARQHDRELATLREEMRRTIDAQPKDDPLKGLIEFMRSQTDAAKETARIQAEAQREAARDQREAMNTFITTMRSEQTNIVPTLISAFGSLGQYQSSVTSTMMDMVREMHELRGKDETPWWGEMLKGALGPLPDIGVALANAYAAKSQAAASAAIGGAPPPAAGPIPPGRQPREHGDGTIPAAQQMPPASPPPTQVAADTGPAAVQKQPTHEERIVKALIGYETDVPNGQADYDRTNWDAMLPDIMRLRALVLEGKLKPKDAGGMLVSMLISKAQLGVAIPAMHSHFKEDHESLATLVGMALGRCPQGRDPQEFLEFKANTLTIVVEALTEMSRRMEAERQAQEQQGGDDEEAGGNDDQPQPPAPAAPPAQA